MSVEATLNAAGFEAILEQLEETVKVLETGKLGLDGSLAKYEEGVRLLVQCYGLLEAAERRVELVTGWDESGRPQTAKFGGSGSAARNSEVAKRQGDELTSVSQVIGGGMVSDEDLPF